MKKHLTRFFGTLCFARICNEKNFWLQKQNADFLRIIYREKF